MRIFSDENYSTLIEENSEAISSSISGLRYLVIQNIDSSANTATAIVEIDNVQFWNGLTVPVITANE